MEAEENVFEDEKLPSSRDGLSYTPRDAVTVLLRQVNCPSRRVPATLIDVESRYTLSVIALETQMETVRPDERD